MRDPSIPDTDHTHPKIMNCFLCPCDCDDEERQPSISGAVRALVMERDASLIYRTIEVTVEDKKDTHPWFQRGSNQAYAFDGVQPGTPGYTIEQILQMDRWYQFVMNFPTNHPFHVSTSDDGGLGPPISEQITKPILAGTLLIRISSSGVRWVVRSVGNAHNRTLPVNQHSDDMNIWTAPLNGLPKLYLQCSIHPRMGVQVVLGITLVST